MIARAAFALAALLACATGPAAAQAPYPKGPVRMIVPFPPGGPTDITARTLGTRLGEVLRQPVVVENRAGARGFIGIEAAARAPADGHTLLLASIGAIAINPVLYPQVPYDVFRDFAPVSLLVTVPIVLVVHPSVPVRTVPELVDYARRNPGKLAYGSAGSGGSTHLVAEMFKVRAGADLLHVPYKGSAPAVADLVGGQVQLMFDTLLTATPHIKSGRLRLVAAATAARLDAFPDTPTIAEAGLAGFDGASWFCLLAPAKTPPEIVERLSRDLAEIVREPAIRARLVELGAEPAGGTPEALAAFIRAEQAKWGAVVREAGIKPD
jgi:tripartite-type tricarboxylate transporter receptor subunit TctC